ncbi:unnamed protein product [Polarella glacialis]|jgi:hypothetical protein|uniref:Uncharacterized protein n=2 Tax=Polarella glacialis TaxID=89957 RepID=A0A813E7V2_POLGL|nr:unnamed protein product [Polarella glacialis]CAE8613565.1 unnamed protein product [Polarella glacialis]CAE8707761.1 unnamed protein product [Polarella glacialis]CAE8739956.1 unnamed protein product [Polarella glacialis]
MAVAGCEQWLCQSSFAAQVLFEGISRFADRGVMAKPPTIWIGTNQAFLNDYAFQYHLISNSYYLCRTATETGLPNEVLFFVEVVNRGTIWHVACEGIIHANGSRMIRQPCFRTTEDFWEEGWHDWECNTNRSRSGTTSTASWNWDPAPTATSARVEVLSCETRIRS